METKEYFEKVMQDFNQHRNGRSPGIGTRPSVFHSLGHRRGEDSTQASLAGISPPA